MLPADSERSDEIGDLTEAFEVMAHKVGSHTEELEQTVRERTAELQRFRSAMDATADAIGHVWPEHVAGATVDITHLAEIITARGEMKDAAKLLEADIADADNRIKVAIGDGELGAVAGVPMFSYRQQAGRKTTCANCGHVTESKPFRVLRSASRKKAA